MYDCMKTLYHQFVFLPNHIGEMEQELYQDHKQLSERLEKEERKMLLRLMDLEVALRNQECLNSFICGYRLAAGIQHELMVDIPLYGVLDENERHVLELLRKERKNFE